MVVLWERSVRATHHFLPEQAPAHDLAPEARAHHAEVLGRVGKILYRGAGAGRPT